MKTLIKMSLTAVACALMLTHAYADNPKPIDVPAGDLVAALESLSKQAEVNLVYQAGEMQGLKTQGVSGTLTPREAVMKLLKGTSLRLSTDEATGAMMISAASAPVKTSDAAQVADLRLAQEDQSKTEMQKVESSSETPKNSDSKSSVSSEVEDDQSSKGMPEVLVRGKKSLNADLERSSDDIQPYIVLSREKIERSGATDFNDLLRKSLPSNTGNLVFTASATPQGNATNVSLRGLGSGQTLILVDGRRAAAYSLSGDLNQPDLNSIPLSAIERIEVLPVSASGLYGGGATGGVINVVLKRDYTGIESSLTYENSFRSSASSQRADLTAGLGLGKTSFLFSGSYSDSNPIQMRDRDFYERGLQVILENNPASIFGRTTPPVGRTTNIRARTGVPLTLKASGASLGSAIAYVPQGYAGVASDGGAAFLQTAGKYGLEQPNTAQNPGGLNRSLGVGSIVKALRATLRHEFSSSFVGFLELSGSKNSSEFELNNMTSTFTLLRTAPNNPFNQDISVTTPTLGADSLYRSSLENRKAVAGLIWHLPWTGWTSSADYTRERTVIAYDAPSAAISTAGSAAVTSGTLDVLRDTNIGSPDFGQYRLREYVDPVRTTLNDAIVRLGGPVFNLPAGSSDLSIQVERSKQQISDYLTHPATGAASFAPARDQTVDSAYAEWRVPLVGPGQSIRGLRLLELQVAGRFDDYESNTANGVFLVGGVPTSPIRRATNRFHAVVPTFGLRLAPTADLMARVSYSEGFLPPGLTQLVPAEDVFLPTGISGFLDPRRGNTPIADPLVVLTGGNPDLKPESSISKSAGLVFTPRFVPGLRLSWDWAKIYKSNNISPLFLSQDVLALETFVPGFITRAPSQNDGFSVGPITVLNQRALNLARAYVEAYDWALDYTFAPQNLGSFSLSGSATQTIHNSIQTTQLAPAIELATLVGVPRWSASASLSWERRNVTLSWASRYYGSYWHLSTHAVSPNYGGTEGPSSLFHDLFTRYRVTERDTSSLLSGVELIVGVKNVFNTQPGKQLVAINGGLYDTRVDPRLRSYYLSVRKAF